MRSIILDYGTPNKVFFGTSQGVMPWARHSSLEFEEQETPDDYPAGQGSLLGCGRSSCRSEKLALAREKFRVGNLYLNGGCTGAVVGRHPFGGFKMSGGGSKAGGPDSLLEFMVPRNVAENTLRRGFAPKE